jgi:hypothetical protein
MIDSKVVAKMASSTTTTMQSIQATLTRLLDSYADDLARRGQLESLQCTLQMYLQQFPSQLLEDIKTLLHLLVDVKSDNAQLWQQVLQIKDELEKVKGSMRDMQERLAVREVMAACNEKWIRETARRGNKGFAYLWKNHLYNIRYVAGDSALSVAWKELLDELQTDEKDARSLWGAFKHVKGALDRFVHVDSFPRFTYQQLKSEVADRVFVGRHGQFKEDFLMFLEVNKRLSDMHGESLYEYEL